MRVATITIDTRYSVNDSGNVFGPRGKLKPMLSRGYQRVEICGKGMRVHRLVAEAFLPKEECKTEVNHKDGNKANNDVSNLEWVDRAGNMRHAIETGLSRMPGRGEDGLRAKLTKQQVDYIRSMYIPKHKEFGQTALGKRFDVTNSCVFRIVHGLNWGG